MAWVLGHRQTKGAATDIPDLPSPRHTSTRPIVPGKRPLSEARLAARSRPLSASLNSPLSGLWLALSVKTVSTDHLVSAVLEVLRHVETQLARNTQVDNELEFRHLLNDQVAGLGHPKDHANVKPDDSCMTVTIRLARDASGMVALSRNASEDDFPRVWHRERVA